MRYTLDNGKTVVIPDKEVEKLMNSLGLTKQDAIDLWLSDNGLEEDEEQEELDKKASKVKIEMDVIQKKSKSDRKKPERKVSDEKKALFNEILANLTEIYGENAKILNENKLIEVKIGEKCFKIDIIEHRPPKKS